MNFGAVSYNSLPAVPSINALPGGIPQGPWGPLYRAAPGAQIPAVRYPGMSGFGRSNGGGVRFMGAISGALGAPVQIVGALGQTSMTKSEAFTGLLIAAGISAATGAGLAMTLRSRRPVLYPSLFMGGLTLGSGLLAILLSKSTTTTPAA